MKTYSTMHRLAALGVLTAAAGPALAAVDTSRWTCETCPFEKAAIAATVEAGAVAVSDDSNRFGDHTGLRRKGARALLGAEASLRTESGLYGNLSAGDLGLGVRSIALSGGSEGLFSLRLAYRENERWLSDGAQTPFLGVGGAVLTLPAGYPAGTTAQMPLSTTLRPVDLGFERSRLDAGFAVQLGSDWSVKLGLRRDTRDGTQRGYGSFFSTAAALPVPVDDSTDQVELSAAYQGRRVQASLAYYGSFYRNGPDSLTWSNPFTAVNGGRTGQMALAPDSDFHQIVANAGAEVLPWLRASGEIAWGQMSQNAAYLAATLNGGLAATLAPLPAASLDGRVDTFNASGRLTASPSTALRLTASYTRDVRDNRTRSLAYPSLATDMFRLDGTRSNQPFDIMQDRWRLSGDYRVSSQFKASAGFDYDRRSRTFQEVVNTRETVVWGRLAAKPMSMLDLSVKLSHGERNHSTYGVATWISPPENPLLRKFNLADRRRDAVGARADFALSEEISLGLSADWTDDQYAHSPVGLIAGRSASTGAELSVAFSDDTQGHAFVQTERVRSRQIGSEIQGRALGDWRADTRDAFEVVGLGIKHVAMKGKIEFTADATWARSRSDAELDLLALVPQFPTATTRRDGLRMQLVYKIQESIALVGTAWYERWRASDWHVDGVAAGTVSNLLAFGDSASRHEVGALGVAVRVRF